MLLIHPPATVAVVQEINRVRAAGACPEAPTGIFTTAAPFCPALEVSGSVVPGAVTVDPAFDLVVRSTQLSHPEVGGNATISAFGADGVLLFSMPFAARGAYRLDLPLAPGAAQAIRLLRVASGPLKAERTATIHGEPNAETIATDDRDMVFAWNARAFPAVRIATDAEPDITYASGTGTYEQLTIPTTAHRLSVDFSDGVRSTKRTFAVFGR